MQNAQGDDFQQQFMAQVRGQETSNGDPVSAPLPDLPKKKLDARWIIIIALIILLIIASIVLAIIGANVTSSQEDDVTQYNENIVGLWGCNDGTDMTFNPEGSYYWENVAEAPIIETGTYEQKNNKVSIMPQTYKVNGIPEDFDSNKYEFEMYHEDDQFIIFFSEGKNLIRSCMRVEV